MARKAQSDVLTLGMVGLGVEIAKYVILAGVRSVAIYNEQVFTGTSWPISLLCHQRPGRPTPKLGLRWQWANYGAHDASYTNVITGQLQVHEPHRHIAKGCGITRHLNSTGRGSVNCGGLVAPCLPVQARIPAWQYTVLRHSPSRARGFALSLAALLLRKAELFH
ncbi:hypothetical protein MTO96_037447 [Rhipicephalus appendiculatus]